MFLKLVRNLSYKKSREIKNWTKTGLLHLTETVNNKKVIKPKPDKIFYDSSNKIYYEEDYSYCKDSKYFYESRKPYYNDELLKYIIENDMKSKCHICEGTGWIKTLKPELEKIKKNFVTSNDAIFCTMCNGIGLS
jgi:hypothetical protein